MKEVVVRFPEQYTHYVCVCSALYLQYQFNNNSRLRYLFCGIKVLLSHDSQGDAHWWVNRLKWSALGPVKKSHF